MNMHMNFILNIVTICYLRQRANRAITIQWFISKFNDIGYILNKHASLRHSISKALFILIQQNNIIMVVLVAITKGCTDTIKVTMVMVQQVQVIKDMVQFKKKKKKKNNNKDMILKICYLDNH